MILLDVGDTHSIDKADDRYYGSTIRAPEPAAARGTGTDSLSLPDYDTSEEQHKVLQQSKSSWRPTRTFWKAALFSLIAYVIITLAVCTPIVMNQMKKKKAKIHPLGPDHSSLFQALSEGPPLESRRSWDFSNITCLAFPANSLSTSTNTSGDKTYHSVTLKYDTLPLAAHIRSNITRGDKGPGQLDASLTVDVAKDASERLARYEITVSTTRGPPLDYTTLCFSDQFEHHGLSIFPSRSYTGDEELSINVHVTLPQAGSWLRDITTYLPDFTQNFGSIDAAQFTVEGANKPITFQSVRAEMISVRNIMAPVQGSFNVSSALGLNVIKGAVNADIVLYSPPLRQDPDGPSFLIEATQSPVTTNIMLDSEAYMPTFQADIRSTNSEVSLTVSRTRSTLKPALALNVENVMANTYVTIDQELNGWYDVQSQLGSVEVQDRTGTNQLHPEYSSKDKAVGIYEQWASNESFSPSGRGQFNLRSSLAHASLAFAKVS